MASFENIVSTLGRLIWTLAFTCETGVELFLEMVSPGSLFLTQIPILIFLGRLSEFSNYLENTASSCKWKFSYFSFRKKVPKDAHVLTDALVQSLENVFLVPVR